MDSAKNASIDLCFKVKYIRVLKRAGLPNALIYCWNYFLELAVVSLYQKKNLDTNDMYKGRLCLISFVSLSNCAMYCLNSLLQTPRGKPLPASRVNPETGVTTLCRSTTRSRPRYRVTGSRSPVGLILNHSATSQIEVSLHLEVIDIHLVPKVDLEWVLGSLLVRCFGY